MANSQSPTYSDYHEQYPHYYTHQRHPAHCIASLPRKKKTAQSAAGKTKPKTAGLQTKSEKDCSCCQANHPQQTVTHQAPVPWSQVKGKGGRKKTIATDDYFCSNECNNYFGITNQNIHAVVGIRNSQQDVWVWAVYDATTKLMPVIKLGGRTQSMAYAMVHQLKTRLHPGHVPVFSSDGLKHYFYALTAHFDEWVPVKGKLLPEFIYGQVLKCRKRKRIIEIQQRLLWGLPKEYRSRLKAAGLTGRINTSFVERANLTIRQSVSKLTRRTWASAQYSSELFEHIYWWLDYYHFSRYQSAL